jgi:hyaluronan synthase
MKSETLTSEQFYTSNPDLNTEQALNSSIFRISNANATSKKVSERTKSKTGLFVLVSTFILMFIGAYTAYQLQADFDQFQLERINSSWGFPFLILAGVLFVFQAGVFLYNLYLYFTYKPIESVSDEMLPTCTVIVPAYNEGKLVWDTLMSLADSDFPEQKMQILAVDDGSKDDTWYWMQQAKIKLGDRLTIFQQPENRGKRHALHRGFELGTGEIFVTVDSDSIVKKDTFHMTLLLIAF